MSDFVYLTDQAGPTIAVRCASIIAMRDEHGAKEVDFHQPWPPRTRLTMSNGKDLFVLEPIVTILDKIRADCA